MLKEQVLKNRQRIRNTLKTCLNKISTDCSSQSTNPSSRKIPQLIYSKIHKLTSQQVRQFDQVMYLRETHLENSFEGMFEKLEKVGEGCHSVVYKCREIKTGRIFAAKIFKNVDTDAVRHFKEHFMIKRAINHQNVIKAHYLFINEKMKRIKMICQYCPFKNLGQYIKNHKNLDEGEIRTILHGIVSGVIYLHRHGICHRDLKPENILYNPKTGQLKLIDFQIAKMSKYIDQPLQMWTNTGTLHYKAPQMFKGSYNEDIDLWAVGIIAYELVYGKLPFECQYVSDTIAEICEKQPNYEKVGVSHFLVDFIKSCLTKDSQKRIKCFNVLHQPFFLSYKEEFSPNFHKKKHSNTNNHFFKGQDCDCDKQNHHDQVSKCHPRRSHSQLQSFNKKNLFTQDNKIRFLEK